MAVDLSTFEHPSWVTAAATGIGYALILALMAAVLFVLPWLVFSSL